MNDLKISPLVRRADHTGFTVQSLAASLPFWTDVLGCRFVTQEHFDASEFLDNVVGVVGAEMTLAMVEAPGGHMIELLEYHAPVGREHLRPRSCDVGSVHVAFLVENLAVLLGRCEEAGWMRIGEPQTVTGGVRNGLILVYVRGPDGITLEFLQPPLTDDNLPERWKNSLNESSEK